MSNTKSIRCYEDNTSEVIYSAAGWDDGLGVSSLVGHIGLPHRIL